MGVLDEHAEQIIVSPSQLAAGWAELEQQMAVFALAVAHVDTTGAWGDDGSVSMLAWMRDRLRMSNADAHAWLRRANLLNQYDAFAECAVTGALSSSQLREVVASSCGRVGRRGSTGVGAGAVVVDHRHRRRTSAPPHTSAALPGP